MGKPRDGSVGATWEKEVVISFCDLCIKEIELGNRPTTFFNKEGWTSIVNHFVEITEREYTKVQLKNKWDQMKKDWKLWKELKRGSTGLGWDSKKKTIAASDDWWKEKLQVVPNAKKFRYAGIDPEMEEKMDVMFGGVVATGEQSCVPAQVLSRDAREAGKSLQVESSNDNMDESTRNIEEQFESSHTKRGSSSHHQASKKMKGASYVRSQISDLVSACKIRAARPTAPACPSLSEAIKALDALPEVFTDQLLYLHSIKVMKDVENREIFLAMLPERRIIFLRSCFESRDS